MAITFEKAQLGYQDFLWDSQGNGATTPVMRSDGNYRQSENLNASHLPVTTELRAKKFADGTTATANSTFDVDSILIQVLDDLEDLGQPDDATLEVASGVLQVKDAGIVGSKIGVNAVANVNVSTGAIDTYELVDNSVDADKLKSDATSANRAVTTLHIQTSAVVADSIAAAAITEPKLAADVVTISKLNLDGSGTAPAYFPIRGGTTESGTGSSSITQAIAAVPSATCIVLATMKVDAGVRLYSAAMTNDTTITFTFSGNTTTSETIQWIVYAPTA